MNRERAAVMSDAAVAVDLVREAAELAAELRREGLSVDHKTSVSDVVTAADRAAERLVLDHLAVLRPEDAIVGEEGASRLGSSGRTWVIDPVDGTYNFVSGLPWWCSAVALREGERGLLGAVHHVAEAATYVGGEGVPPTRNGMPLVPLPDLPLDQVCVATYLHPPDMLSEVGETWQRGVRTAATVRMLGSGTLDLLAVAQGHLGVYLGHSVPEWDWFPGSVIVAAAGGATARVRAGGVTWSVAGRPTAVSEVVAGLEQR